MLSVTAISAADISNTTSVPDSTSSGTNHNSVIKDNANIESNSIEKKVSNEYETITKNVKSDTSENKNQVSDEITNNNTKEDIVIKLDPVSAFVNDEVYFNATVKTTSGKNVDSADAVIKVNGNTIAQPEVINGKILLNYTVPDWKPKDYNVTLKVLETDNTLSNSADSTLTIQKHNISITLNPIEAKSEENVEIKVLVNDSEGNPVDDAKVVYKVNRKTMATATTKNGVAIVNYTVPRRAENYPLLVKVGETTLTAFNSNETTLTVTKRNASISTQSTFQAKCGGNVTLSAKITNDGNVEATGKIGFKINGKTIKIIQLENSSASFTYDSSKLGNGSYVITIVYGGSGALTEVRLNTTLRVQDTIGATFTLKQILQKANLTEEFIIKNGQLPNYANMNGTHVSMPDFLYMLCEVVLGNTSSYVGGFSKPTSSLTTVSYGKLIEEDDFVGLARNIIQCYKENGRAPNNIKTPSNVSISYVDAVYMYTRIVSFMNDTGRLPTFVKLVSGGSSDSSDSGSSSSESSTSNYTPSNIPPSGLSEYLQVTKNCQVNSTTIKNAVAAATSGVTGVYNQAKAIFDYVNRKTSYSSYFNTRYGAVGTLNRGYGNCVDMAHVVIAMSRTANIPARYCHSTCYFRSGLVVGHVWAEIYVDGTWYSCDATSDSNSFGKIVNWNRCTSIKRYSSLPF